MGRGAGGVTPQSLRAQVRTPWLAHSELVGCVGFIFSFTHSPIHLPGQTQHSREPGWVSEGHPSEEARLKSHWEMGQDRAQGIPWGGKNGGPHVETEYS